MVTFEIPLVQIVRWHNGTYIVLSYFCKPSTSLHIYTIDSIGEMNNRKGRALCECQYVVFIVRFAYMVGVPKIKQFVQQIQYEKIV